MIEKRYFPIIRIFLDDFVYFKNIPISDELTIMFYGYGINVFNYFFENSRFKVVSSYIQT